VKINEVSKINRSNSHLENSVFVPRKFRSSRIWCCVIEETCYRHLVCRTGNVGSKFLQDTDKYLSGYRAAHLFVVTAVRTSDLTCTLHFSYDEEASRSSQSVSGSRSAQPTCQARTGNEVPYGVSLWLAAAVDIWSLLEVLETSVDFLIN
jgi:hypothetical protein